MMRTIWPLLLMVVSQWCWASDDCPDYFKLSVRTLNSMQTMDLCQLTHNKVVLVVNTASYCNFSPQFQDLETLYQDYKENGLVILGFPSNDFLHEANSEQKIERVSRQDYSVTFPMFMPIHVRGAQAFPLFQYLTQAPHGGPPAWNFHKYLIGRDGRLIASFNASQSPLEDAIKWQIRSALGLYSQ